MIPNGSYSNENFNLVVSRKDGQINFQIKIQDLYYTWGFEIKPKKFRWYHKLWCRYFNHTNDGTKLCQQCLRCGVSYFPYKN